MQEEKLKRRDGGGYQKKSIITDQKNPKQNRLDLFVCNKGKREVTPSEIEIACQDKLQIDEGEKRSVIYLC